MPPRARRWPEDDRPFGLSWFLPEIVQHRPFFAGVAVAAILSNLIGFAIPLLFQVLIDKVVPHQAWQTLTVLVLDLRACWRPSTASSCMRGSG